MLISADVGQSDLGQLLIPQARGIVEQELTKNLTKNLTENLTKNLTKGIVCAAGDLVCSPDVSARCA